MDGGAWWAIVHGVAKSRTRQRLHFLFLFPGDSVVNNPPVSAGHSGNTGWGRVPGVGNGNPLQYSCLKNSTD